jgi:transmembrane sensor
VSLLEGHVDVTYCGTEQEQKLGSLDPGEVCTFFEDKSTYQIRKDDVKQRMAWTEGKLIFRDQSFKEVVKKCNRWYNVNIVIIDQELEEYTYVGTLQDETLEEVLKLLSLTAPMKYIDRGRARRKDGTFEKRLIELRLKS